MAQQETSIDARPSTEMSTEMSAEEKAAAEARALEVSRELLSREAAIELMRGEQGIYAAGLQEVYSDLGAFFEEIEDYENAISVLAEALQVARINTGLYSEQQLPVISQLVENNSKLQDWQEVDDLQQLALLINSRIYELGSENHITAVEEYGKWRLRLLKENLLEMNYRGLSNTAAELSVFYSSHIEKVESREGSSPLDILQMLYGKVEADLALAQYVASIPYTAFEGLVSPYINQTRCQNVRNSAGAVVRQCYNVRVENPRYRQSQRDAKRIEINRYNRTVRQSLQRMGEISLTEAQLSAVEKESLDSEIVRLQTQIDQVVSLNRRNSLF